MSKSKKQFVSESRNASLVSLLKCLYVIVMDINNNTITQYVTPFKGWLSESSTILRKMGVHSEFLAEVGSFSAKKRFTHEQAVEIGKLLGKQKKIIEADTTVSAEELNLFNACVSNLTRDSESSWKKMYKGVSLLREPLLSAEWIEHADPVDAIVSNISPDKALKAVKAVLSKFNGDATRIWLSTKQLTEFRTSDPVGFSEYAQNIKVLNSIIKAATQSYVRKSGKDKVTVDELRGYFDSNRITHNLVRGLSGALIDENGIVYTREGIQLQRIPAGAVAMNPQYDPATDNTYVCKEVATGIRHSTVHKTMSTKGGKFSAVQEFLKSESTHRARWAMDLKKDGSREQVLACMIELMWATSSRIGDKGNATAGKETFGLSTIQVQHVKFGTDSVTLKFPGKKAFDKEGNLVNEQHFVYQAKDNVSKKALQVLKTLVSGKTKRDTVFTFNGSPLLRQYVGKYIKDIGIGLSAHGFRHINGTRSAMTLLSKCHFSKGDATQAQVDKWVKETLTKVGAALHHRTGEKVTAMTAIKSYIDPSLLVNFYADLGLRTPKWVPAARSTD